MSNKYIVAAVAIIAAFMMLAIPFAASSSDADPIPVSSATSVSTGEFNIYFSVDSEYSDDLPNNQYLNGITAGWVGYTGYGYNAYLATVDVLGDMGLSAATYSFDTAYVISSGGYSDINSNYGTMSKLFNLSDGDASWTIYAYNTSTSTWNAIADSALGWYKPFSDYASYLTSYGTANIAFYYGDTANLPSMTSLTIKSITSVTQTATFAYSFYFEVNDSYTPTISSGVVTVVQLHTGIPMTIYGSDAFMALVNTFGTTDIESSYTTGNPGYNSYSWFDSAFNLETTNDWSHYWATYTDIPATAYSDYCLGAYSCVAGAPLVHSTFSFVYI